jgi:hypothetical protein
MQAVDLDSISTDGEKRVFSLHDDTVESLSDKVDTREFLRSPTSTTSSRVLSPAISSSESKASSFRARNLPPTHEKPDIQPRMSRAAALRMGVELPAVVRERKEQEPDLTTPGVNKRPLTAADLPKSLAKPAITPRQTRASQLRATGEDSPARRSGPRLSLDTSRRGDAFAGYPGFKRRESLAVESCKQPTITVRTTRASMLREGRDSPSVSDVHKRRQSLQVTSTRSPTPGMKSGESPAGIAFFPIPRLLISLEKFLNSGCEEDQRSQAQNHQVFLHARTGARSYAVEAT